MPGILESCLESNYWNGKWSATGHHPQWISFWLDWIAEGNYHFFEHQGLFCEMKRHPEDGTWCGYFIVESTDGLGLVDENDYCIEGIDLTFRDGMKFGFDCASSLDFVPGRNYYFTDNVEGKIYRNFAWVKEHLKDVVDKILALQN